MLAGQPRAATASQETNQIFRGKVRVIQDAAECSRLERLMIGNHNTRRWRVAIQDHVTSALTGQDKAGTFERAPQLVARNACR